MGRIGFWKKFFISFTVTALVCIVLMVVVFEFPTRTAQVTRDSSSGKLEADVCTVL